MTKPSSQKKLLKMARSRYQKLIGLVQKSFTRDKGETKPSTYSKLGINDDHIVKCSYGGETLVFACSSDLERYRVQTLETKEPGTVQWIADYCKPSDVFYDIGANIGLYTLLAALRVGSSGRVYAFEPHSFNFVSLVRNIVLNNLTGVVFPLSCGLGDVDKIDVLNYKSLDSGSSDSQLGTNQDMKERVFEPAFKEAKVCLTLDTLVFKYQLPFPTHIKIDVDGNELLILQGMEQLLSGPHKPKSLQVEINRRYRDKLFSFMESVGYRLVAKHYTASGSRKLERAGTSPKFDESLIPYNAVFIPNEDHS